MKWFFVLCFSVRFPTDGLYTGKVDAIDALRHCYRVTFDKPTLGTRSIPDYEVLSILPQETIPLSAYKTQHKASRNLFMSPARLLAQSALQVCLVCFLSYIWSSTLDNDFLRSFNDKIFSHNCVGMSW